MNNAKALVNIDILPMYLVSMTIPIIIREIGTIKSNVLDDTMLPKSTCILFL